MIIIEEEYNRKIIEFLRHYGYHGNEIEYLYQIRYNVLDDGSIEKTYNKYNIIDETNSGKIVYQMNNSLMYIKKNKIYDLHKKPKFSQDNKIMTLNILCPNEEFFNENMDSFFEILDNHLLEFVERRLPKYKNIKELIVEYQKEIDTTEKLIETVQEIISKKLLTD